MAETEPIEVDRVTVARWPDDSRIEMNRYRSSPIAPWISGLHEVACGACREEVGEYAEETDARIALLEHMLGDIQSELAAMRAAFLRAGGYRAR